ncbi:MAG: class I SAM-dependent methyltransferase [Candidatus Omnitrophica bacterium]|nr:class I SAM-dependent methyltransferase [Candidatus Omnitrophota bacterium]
MNEPNMFGFKLWQKWHCYFPFQEAPARLRAGSTALSPEPRIAELSRRLDLKGLRILELGSMEGVHSYMLESLGAREVLAVEGRKDNFLKSLVVKNAFGLDTCRFLLGDFKDVLGALEGEFDLCLALGVLYHLENPAETLYRIGELARSLFVWSHYATQEYPVTPEGEVSHTSRVYKGKFVLEDTEHYTSGLSPRSFWLFEDQLLALINDAGFRHIDVVSKERHEHGPAITLFARR